MKITLNPILGDEAKVSLSNDGENHNYIDVHVKTEESETFVVVSLDELHDAVTAMYEARRRDVIHQKELE